MTAAALAWVKQQEEEALAGAPFAKEALTIVPVDLERIHALARVMPGAFAGVEGGCCVVTLWVRGSHGVLEADRWFISPIDNEFHAVAGPFPGRFPLKQPGEFPA